MFRPRANGLTLRCKTCARAFCFLAHYFLLRGFTQQGANGQSGSAALRRREQCGHSGDVAKAKGRSTINVNAFSQCHFHHLLENPRDPHSLSTMSFVH